MTQQTYTNGIPNDARFTVQLRKLVQTNVSGAELSKTIAAMIRAEPEATADDLKVTRTDGPTIVKAAPKSDPEICTVGRDRALADQKIATANGFSLGQEFFAVGTKLYQSGVDRARELRQQFDALPSAELACTQGIERVQAEQRKDVVVDSAKIAMRPDGMIATGEWRNDGKIEKPIIIGAIDVKAYGAMCTRMGVPSDSRCTSAHPDIRARVFNGWANGKSHPQGKRPDDTMVLRTRNAGPGKREIFAAVSESYGALDVDMLLRATEMAVRGQGGRASLVYDGRRSRIRVLWHNPIAPEGAVVGEILQAWVGWGSDDTGSGSIGIDAGLFHVLCKNLGHALPTKRVATIRHLGDVAKLARAFRTAFAQAQRSIDGYVQAWNVATCDDLRSHDWAKELLGVTSHEFIGAIFRGLLTRDDRIKVAVTGKTEDRVKDLVSMWERDDSSAVKRAGSLTRASVVNAFTRYAHEVNEDTWKADDIERAGSALLFSDRAMPWCFPEDSDG